MRTPAASGSGPGQQALRQKIAFDDLRRGLRHAPALGSGDAYRAPPAGPVPPKGNHTYRICVWDWADAVFNSILRSQRAGIKFADDFPIHLLDAVDYGVQGTKEFALGVKQALVALHSFAPQALSLLGQSDDPLLLRLFCSHLCSSGLRCSEGLPPDLNEGDENFIAADAPEMTREATVFAAVLEAVEPLSAVIRDRDALRDALGAMVVAIGLGEIAENCADQRGQLKMPVAVASISRNAAARALLRDNRAFLGRAYPLSDNAWAMVELLLECGVDPATCAIARSLPLRTHFPKELARLRTALGGSSSARGAAEVLLSKFFDVCVQGGRFAEAGHAAEALDDADEVEYAIMIDVHADPEAEAISPDRRAALCYLIRLLTIGAEGDRADTSKDIHFDEGLLRILDRLAPYVIGHGDGPDLIAPPLAAWSRADGRLFVDVLRSAGTELLAVVEQAMSQAGPDQRSKIRSIYVGEAPERLRRGAAAAHEEPISVLVPTDDGSVVVAIALVPSVAAEARATLHGKVHARFAALVEGGRSLPENPNPGRLRQENPYLAAFTRLWSVPLDRDALLEPDGVNNAPVCDAVRAADAFIFLRAGPSREQLYQFLTQGGEVVCGPGLKEFKRPNKAGTAVCFPPILADDPELFDELLTPLHMMVFGIMEAAMHRHALALALADDPTLAEAGFVEESLTGFAASSTSALIGDLAPIVGHLKRLASDRATLRRLMCPAGHPHIQAAIDAIDDFLREMERSFRGQPPYERDAETKQEVRRKSLRRQRDAFVKHYGGMRERLAELVPDAELDPPPEPPASSADEVYSQWYRVGRTAYHLGGRCRRAGDSHEAQTTLAGRVTMQTASAAFAQAAPFLVFPVALALADQSGAANPSTSAFLGSGVSGYLVGLVLMMLISYRGEMPSEAHHRYEAERAAFLRGLIISMAEGEWPEVADFAST